MNNALDGLISRLDMSKRTSELEDIAVDTFKTKKQRGRRLKKADRIFENCWTIVKGNVYVIRTSEGEERKKRTEEIFAN